MGGVVNMDYTTQCCIHDSKFKDAVENKENIETIEKEAMKLGGVAIERASSFISEFSPRQHSKKSNAD